MRILPLLCALAVGAHALSDHLIDQSLFLTAKVNKKRTSEAEQDRVHSLPGTGDLDFDLFAGYITVDDDAERALFYTLAESSSSQPDKDPLVLFLNGGPGCSSLGGGFLSELGPFYPSIGGKNLVKNEFAWNQLANVLFLESPAFVGWSYSNTSDDAIVGDERTAKDSLTFLIRFMERFPEYQDRPFWLAGESYAGHYLPNLALEILNNQKKEAMMENKKERTSFNFKGFLLGNPLTVPEIDSSGALKFWYTHGIISEDSYHGAMKYCDLTEHEPLNRFVSVGAGAGAAAESDGNNHEEQEEEEPAFFSNRKLQRAASWSTAQKDDEIEIENGIQRKDSEKCEDYIIQAMDEMAGINIYDIYADVCLEDQKQKERKQRNFETLLKSNADANLVSTLLSSLLKQPPQPRYDPCISDEVEIYMNRPDVQAAFNANSSGHQQPGPWVTCTPKIAYSRDDVLTSMLPVYDELLGSGIEFLVYSGDIDAIVPIIGTRRWIRSLDLEVEEKWRAWRSSTGQVAGWTVKYAKGLTFASVRGAGHMVPYTQAERAFHMFSRWVHGKPL